MAEWQRQDLSSSLSGDKASLYPLSGQAGAPFPHLETGGRRPLLEARAERPVCMWGTGWSVEGPARGLRARLALETIRPSERRSDFTQAHKWWPRGRIWDLSDSDHFRLSTCPPRTAVFPKPVITFHCQVPALLSRWALPQL